MGVTPTALQASGIITRPWLLDANRARRLTEPSPDNIQVDPGRDMPYLVEYVDAKGVHQGRAMFAKATEVINIRPAPDLTPFSQAQLDAAEKLAAAAVKAAADRAAAAYGA